MGTTQSGNVSVTDRHDKARIRNRLDCRMYNSHINIMEEEYIFQRSLAVICTAFDAVYMDLETNDSHFSTNHFRIWHPCVVKISSTVQIAGHRGYTD
jgi:hypothetical protein